MSVPMGVIRLVLTGNLASGEVFAFGQWFAHALTGGQTELDSICDAYVGLVTTNKAAIFTQNNTSDSSITGCSGYAYTDTSGEATVVSHRNASIVGGASSGVTLPLQCSYVVSTRTAINGRRYRGRFYVPMTAFTLTNHQMTTAQVTAIGAAWQNVLDGMLHATPPLTPSVVSATGTVTTPITQLLIDTRIDIQRRRANKQAVVGTAVVPIS